MSGFVTMPFKNGTCNFCQFELMQGEPLLGHDDDHVFHLECLLKTIRENPANSVRCPECDFVATRIDGESIAICIKQLGIKPPRPPVLSEHRYSLEFILAASELDVFTLQQLLEANCPLSVKERGEAVAAAARAGDDGSIIHLLLSTGSISDIDRGKAAIASMKNRQLIAFQLLVGDGQLIDADNFSAAIIEAVKTRQTAFLRILLSLREVDPATRALAIEQALKFEAFNIVQELLPEGAIIPECFLEKLLLRAVRLGRQDILKLLCRQPISVQIRKTVIQCAKDLKQVKVAQWLQR